MNKHQNTVVYITANDFFIHFLEQKFRFNILHRSQISVLYFSYKVPASRGLSRQSKNERNEKKK